MQLGILGGGQLALMLAEAAKNLGIGSTFLDPSNEACAKSTAQQIAGDFDDISSLQALAATADVITYEFENIPLTTISSLQQGSSVYPGVLALEKTQDRLTEKTFLNDLGIAVADFYAVGDSSELKNALKKTGYPAILKARRFGYDGKGQYLIRNEKEAQSALKAVPLPAILEKGIAFEREVSIIGVRNSEGIVDCYPLVENTHTQGILYQSRALIDDPLQDQAEALISELMGALDYTGVLALELFQLGDQLIANEYAPRVHNTGHWTIEGCEASQFENHVRAVCGLPVRPCAPIGYTAMINCIGQMPTAPDIDGLYFHDYGKTARPGRKVGHITVTAFTEKELDEKLAVLKQALPANILS